MLHPSKTTQSSRKTHFLKSLSWWLSLQGSMKHRPLLTDLYMCITTFMLERLSFHNRWAQMTKLRSVFCSNLNLNGLYSHYCCTLQGDYARSEGWTGTTNHIRNQTTKQPSIFVCLMLALSAVCKRIKLPETTWQKAPFTTFTSAFKCLIVFFFPLPSVRCI